MIEPRADGLLRGGRFAGVAEEKAAGATYTPRPIAEYLAEQLASTSAIRGRALSILDPAIGDGALAVSLLRAVFKHGARSVRLVGHETDPRAAAAAREAIRSHFQAVELYLRESDFLGERGGEAFDLAIANPPYVRAQILGAAGSGRLASRYGLTGRIDLYQAFALEIIERLSAGGALGLILSNRFLSIKGAAAFRDALSTRLDIARLWDLGDTKAFDAAILPAMLLGRKRQSREQGTSGQARPSPARFTSIYEEGAGDAGSRVISLVEALDQEGRVRLGDRTFRVSQGVLHGSPGDVWRVSSGDLDDWLRAIEQRTWKRLGEIGRVRVGIKTTADKVFIRDDWHSMGDAAPELLRPLITHHVAGRYRGSAPAKKVLYPHVESAGRREVANLAHHPRAHAYLARHRPLLERRRYLIEAGRAWYELWVPQDPRLWSSPKIVFRDISERPTFWIDESGSVVNGDCYWLSPRAEESADALWLALAVTNSSFVEAFYDRCFNNKLYSRRRRFMSQYVEKFPLPSPEAPLGRELVVLAKRRYASEDASEQGALERSMDDLVWRAFGLSCPAAGKLPIS